MKEKLCIMCEHKFVSGWVPRFHAEGIDTRGYGVCKACLDLLYPTPISELQREEQLIGIYLDWVEQELNTVDKRELARQSLSRDSSEG